MAKVLFTQLSSFELNSFQILSAFLKKNGHTTEIFSLALENYSKLNKLLNLWKPDIIGFTVTSFDYMSILTLARKIKEDIPHKVHIVFGGPHAIISPMELISYPQVDFVCICEGEYILKELADAIDSGAKVDGIQGLWSKVNGNIIKSPPRNFIEDLGALPLDDKELYYKRYPLLREAPFKVFTVSRGCPYSCTYCSNNYMRKLIKGKSLRFRPAKQVVEEIVYIKQNYPLKYVMFRSDSFSADKKWCTELLNEYKKKIKIPFYAQVVMRELSASLIKSFAEAGMKNIIFAIESGSERIRQEILRRPAVKNSEILELSEIIRRYGIKITTQEMFAIPTETLEEAFMTVELNVKIKARMTPTILQPYLHTEITKYYDMRKVTNSDGTHFVAKSNLEGKDVSRIVVLQRISGWICRLPWGIYKRIKPIIKLITWIPDNLIFKLFSNLNYLFVQRRLSNYSGSYPFFLRYGFYASKSYNLRQLKNSSKQEETERLSIN